MLTRSAILAALFGRRTPEPGPELEEYVRWIARDEIAKREQKIAKELDAARFAKLLSWGAPPPPRDKSEVGL